MCPGTCSVRLNFKHAKAADDSDNVRAPQQPQSSAFQLLTYLHWISSCVFGLFVFFPWKLEF